MTLYIALGIMGLLGIVLGGVIGIFVKIFKVEKMPARNWLWNCCPVPTAAVAAKPDVLILPKHLPPER